MALLATILKNALLIWFGLLALLVIARMIRGNIPITGILAPQAGEHTAPERLIALVIFLFVLADYAQEALNVDLTVTDKPPSMPDISQQFLILMTSGNALYLAGKISRLQKIRGAT